MANILGEPRPTFRIRRPLPTNNGFGSGPDPTVLAKLAELERLLGRRVFTVEERGDEEIEAARERAGAAEHAADKAEKRADKAERKADDAAHTDPGAGGVDLTGDVPPKSVPGNAAKKRGATTGTDPDEDEIDKAVEAEQKSADAAARQAAAERRAAGAIAHYAALLQGGGGFDLEAALAAPLTPRRAADPERWADDSLGALLTAAPDGEHLFTLAEIIDADPALSELSAGVATKLRSRLFTLPEGAQIILGGGYPAIRDYLVLLGYGVLKIDDVDGLVHFLVSARRGAAAIADYAVISAGREVVRRRALNVPNFDEDDSAFVKNLRAAALAGKVRITEASFEKGVLAVANKQLFATNERELFAQANVGELPEALKESIIRQMVKWPGGVTEDNVDFVVYSLLGQTAEAPSDEEEPTEPEVSEEDFEVEFVEDEDEQQQVNKNAVLCASQLFYTMVVGEEMDVFGAVEYLTHRFLLRADAEVSEPQLRRDLQDYVFSGRFTDLKTGRRLDRTRASERQMFTRQVFDAGGAEVADGQLVNEHFPRLWKTLMLESANYLERAQESFNPDSFVSRQKVMQAVEDTQENLSRHCTGMATVSTPLVYKEVDFVIRRFLMHNDVLRQVAPNGGTWLRVLENLAAARTGGRKPNATVLYNKARYGHDILVEIANYEPAKFEDDEHFSAFISKVDAFITTQSILQDALVEDVKRDQVEPDGPPDMMPPMPPLPGASVGAPAQAANGAGPHDEWDF